MTAMQTSKPKLLKPVTGPMVWKRADLESDQSWMVEFSSQQLETIDRAIQGVADKKVFEFGIDDFPLPGMEEFFVDLRHELDHGRCLKLIRGIDVDQYSIEQLYKLYWGFGCNLGTPIIQNAKGELLGEVTDRGNDYSVNNVRGYTTSQEIRFHCDSGDVVGLLCVHPSKSGGQSRICCSAAVHNEMLATTPELLDPLYEGFHWDLRGEGATGDKNETSWEKVPVFHYHEDRLSTRFNGKTITDGMRKAGKPLNSQQTDAVARVWEITEDPEFYFDMEFRKGDIQLLSNHDVLHARTAFEDHAEPERKRRLLRQWINLPEPRPMRDDFTNRFNTGPRQGPAKIDGAGYWAGA